MAMSRRQESFRTKSLKLLECTVCLDTIDVPKTLKCDHSFCKNCLADILKSKLLEDDVLQAPKDRMHITCPNCKLDSEPFNSLGELKTHLFVNQLLDVHNDEIERETPTTVCICKEKARFQCYRCKDAYCHGCCRKQIGKHCTVQNDEVVSFTRCEMKHFFVKLPKEEEEALCKDHSLSLEFYCTICKDVICMDCFLLSHKQHETKTIKYGKNEALELANIIKSIRKENASGYDVIYELALQIKRHLVECGRDIINQMEDTEMKIHALISSIFNKTKLHCEQVLGNTEIMMQETMNQCKESNNSNEVSHKLSGIGDLQLASMLDELAKARQKAENETGMTEEVVKTMLETHNAPMVLANEEAIFNSIIDLFKHITFDPPQYERSISDDFTFEGYMNDEYVVKMAQEEGNDNASSSVEEENEISVVDWSHPALQGERPSWYVGKLSREQAETLLMSTTTGTFIVRESDDILSDLWLSVQEGSNVKHYTIHQLHNRIFQISSFLQFSTLSELIDYYQHQADGFPVKLSKPLLRNSTTLQPHLHQGLKELSRSDITLTEMLQKGEFSEMWKGKLRDGDRSMDISVEIPILDLKTREDFFKESMIMTDLNHSNIVRIHGCCSEESPMLIVTEFLGKGNLREYLRKNKGKFLEIKELSTISTQVASGMAYLEKHNIVHGHLAAQNIFMAEGNVVKIFLSLARALTLQEIFDDINLRVLIRWMPPEVIVEWKFSTKSDVWSFGILLYEILTYDRLPYTGLTNAEVGLKVIKGYRLPKPYFCPDILYEIMQACWKEEPEHRPSFNALQNILTNMAAIESGSGRSLFRGIKNIFRKSKK